MFRPSILRRRHGRRACVALASAALLVGLVAPVSATSGAKPAGDDAKSLAAPTGQLDAASLSNFASQRLRKPVGAPSTSTVTAAAGSPVDPIDLRVLVLATKGDPNPDGVNTVPSGSWDWSLSTVTSALDHIGTPYDVYKATTRELCVGGSWKINYSVNPLASTCTSGNVTPWDTGVVQARLWDGGVHAYYQGVMQTNGTLSYLDAAGAFVNSALTADEWAALWTFEAAFVIRTVSLNTYPTVDFGMSYVSEGHGPDNARWTAAGASAFPYVNASTVLPISNSFAYRGTVVDTNTVPLITDASNNVYGVIRTYPTQGNRQALALTFDSAAYFVSGQLLGYGLVNWVTKGLFLGQRQSILAPQTDDIFIGDSVWQETTPCLTAPDDPSLPEYRITGKDLTAYINWQSGVQKQPFTSAFWTEFPFNGEGTTAAYNSPVTDTLTPVAKSNQAKFKWVNHTYTHQNLDAVTYTQAQFEIQQNFKVAQSLRLTTYSKANLIQPDISGLTNAAFLQAAYDAGVRNLISDTSRTGDPAAYGANEGRYNALVPGILEVARYPVNLYFNVTTPQQWLAEDNCLYPVGAPFGHVDSYDQLLDRESNNLLRYLLTGANRPLMFHQTNLRAYSGSRSLLGDLVDATLTKYRQYVKVAITSPTMNAIANLQADRMSYNAAMSSGAVTASIVPGVSITLSSTRAVTVPVTGLASAKGFTVQSYGGQRIAYIKLTAGQSVTLPLA